MPGAAKPSPLSTLLESGSDPLQLFSSVLDAVDEVMLLYDRHGAFLCANAAARNYFGALGLTPETSAARARLTGQFFEMPSGRRLSAAELPLARALRGEMVPRAEYLLTNVDDQPPFWLNAGAVTLRLPTGEINGAVLTFRNITNDKIMDAQVAAQRLLLNHVYDRCVAGILHTTADGCIVDCNDAMVRMLGYSSREELCAQQAAAIHYFPESRARLLSTLAPAMQLDEYEICFRRKDGSPCWALINVSEFQPPGQPGLPAEAAQLIGTVVDISQRKLWEESVRQSERRFSAFMRHLPGFAFIKDLDGRYAYYNEASMTLFGRKPEDVIGRTDLEMWPGDLALEFRRHDAEVIANRRPIEVVETIPHADGPHSWLVYKFPIVEGGGVPLIGGIGIDITERLQLEEKLTQAGKMEALGRLAGGVAHDFNNLLTLISGYGQLIFEGVGRAPEPRLKSYVQEILTSAQRASGLTAQLLAFSRRQNAQPTVLDLRDLVHSLEQLLQRTLGEDVELIVVCGSESCPIRVDLHQMEKVLMNLAMNARDAMPLGGTLEIECRRVQQADDADPSTFGVVLEVRDTGIGMDEATKDHIFEPFFTSKDTGKGTGLGLSSVYAVVAQAGGEVDVQSTPGEGTVFRLRFPLAPHSANDHSPAPASPLTGFETVLVVEDEPSLRNLVETILRRLGYQVILAESGAHALELHRQSGGTIDILLTDVIMPQMSGAQLAGELRQIDPKLKVLFMSGYTDDMLAGYGVLGGKTQLIQKPFTMERLGHALRAVLESAATPGPGSPAPPGIA